MISAEFKNIGPIQKANLELGNLTIIAGQNNTGKTYLVYTLYGFLRFLKDRGFRFMLMERSRTRIDLSIIKLGKTLLESGKAYMEIAEYQKSMDQFLQHHARIFSDQIITDVFSSPNGEFENAEIVLSVRDAIGDKTKHTLPVGRGGVFLNSEVKDNNLVFELDNPADSKIPNHHLVRHIYLAMERRISNRYPEPFILSAERFGISLFYKELDITRNRLVDKLQNWPDGGRTGRHRSDPLMLIERESSRYAQPIKDNIDFTRELSDIKKRRGGIPTGKNRSVEAIIEGYYKAENDDLRFISTRKGSRRFDVPLHLASSSARGLLDMYFYLKHIARTNQLLIIDEPESHLSPTNQVLMARLLVFCVNAGVKVLITTHSDYLIKEINNLIMLNEEFDGKNEFLRKHKQDYTENDRLNPNSVKAYISSGGELQECKVDSRGIDMPVFDGAIDKINKIANTLNFILPDEEINDA